MQQYSQAPIVEQSAEVIAHDADNQTEELQPTNEIIEENEINDADNVSRRCLD